MDFITPVSREELTEKGYPTPEKMVELVNTDLLVFFDDNKPSESLNNVEDYKVTEFLGETGKDFIFQRADGNRLGAWKEYFLNPEEWKENRLLKLQGVTY